MRLTLRTKLIALTTLLVAGIMASVTYFFTFRELNNRRAEVEAQVARIAQNIATMQLLDRQDWGVYQNYISRITSLNHDIVYIAVRDHRGTLRAHTLNRSLVQTDHKGPLPRRVQARIVERLDNGGVAEESRKDLRTHGVNIQLGDRVLGSVHVGFSLIDLNEEMRRGILRNLAMGLFFLLLAGVLSYFLSRRLTSPLERLSLAMRSIAEGDLSQRVAVETRDEIGQLARTFNEMVDGLRERRIIESLGREIGTIFQLDRLSRLVRSRLSGAIGAAGARLFLREREHSGAFRESAIETENGQSSSGVVLDPQVQSLLVRSASGFMMDDAPEGLRHALRDAWLPAPELVIPMVVKGELLGLLLFALPEVDTRVSDKKRLFAATLASQAGLALENAMLYEEVSEQERLKHELRIARDVQRRLLPREMPQVPGLRVEGICRPAREVGGDYFDFFEVAGSSLGLVVADVSGKGTSASFYMAEIKGMMLLLSASCPSPKILLTELNRRLYESFDREVFATMLYGVVDPSRGRFTFARAGHNPLMHLSARGSCRLITPAGIGLGLDSGTVFERTVEEVDLDLRPGDTFVMYTDGLTEAMNADLEQFGEDRLQQAVQSEAAPCTDVVELRERILGAVESFVDGARQHDDLTMVLVQYCGQSS